MHLHDFLDIEKQGRNKKVIITNRVSLGNALIRKMNIENGLSMFNTECRNVYDIAKELVYSFNAFVDNGKSNIDMTTPEIEVYVMKKVLETGEYKSFDKRSLSSATIKDVVDCVNSIRLSNKSDDLYNDTREKITDIRNVCEAYEKQLRQDSLVDKALIISDAMKSIAEIQAGGMDIYYCTPWLKDAVIGVLSTEVLFDKEREFIDSLAKFTKSEEIVSLDYLHDNTKHTKHFYKAYGKVNEINQVIRCIKDKDSDYGNITVYYPSVSYINFIKAAFDNARIPYVITNGAPAVENNLVKYMIALIESAREDFSYQALEKVILNKDMTFGNVIEKDEVKINPITGYRDALAYGIGWGKERYTDYYKRCMEQCAIDEKDMDAPEWVRDKVPGKRIFAEFLLDYVNAFDEGTRAEQIFMNVINFTLKYTFKSNPEKAFVKEKLYKECECLHYLGDENMSLNDKLEIMLDFLENLTVDNESDPSAVNISLISGMMVIERSDNYFIGLSAGEFTLDTKQSPILLDDEKIHFLYEDKNQPEQLFNCPLDIKSIRNLKRRFWLNKSLNTLCEGEFTFIYSYYNVIDLRDDSPSVFFIEQLGDYEVEQADGYDYIDEDIRIDSKEMLDYFEDKVKKIQEKSEKTSEGEKEIISAEKMSSTSMQELLACPLKYYYRYENKLKVNTQRTPEGHIWLDPSTRGTLCHGIMEEYFTKGPNDSFDENLYSSIVDEQLAEIEKILPAPSDAIKIKESKDVENTIKEYVIRLTSKIKADKDKKMDWKVVGCELEFENLPYKDTSKDGYHFDLLLRGSIDRMDAYTADDILYIRIVDYKTGSMEKKKNEVEEYKQIQHYVYALAAIDYVRTHKEKFEEMFGIENVSKVEFVEVSYEFPYEEPERDILDVTEYINEQLDGEDIDSLKLKLPDIVTEQIQRTIGARQNGKVNEIAAYYDEWIQDKISELIAEEETNSTGASEASETSNIKMLSKFCSKNYCDYISICRKRI